MTRPTKVSLVIVSRNRTQSLAKLLQSLRFQTHPNFEVIVVADQLPPNATGSLKFVQFDDANISAARNVGICHSAGDLVAFCDDDAIPDPHWIDRLSSVFEDEKIGSATGYTRARNGISLQWGAARFDRSGSDVPFDIDAAEDVKSFVASPDCPVKLTGTNMMIRKTALQGVTGFDESIRFYLDETDLKLRLDEMDWETAVVPSAQVHHKFEASDRRRINRAPTDLFEVGASKAYFCKKHLSAPDDTALRRFTSEQLERLTAMVDDRRLRRRQLDTLMQSLARGFEDGMDRVERLPNQTDISTPFTKFDTAPGDHVVLCATMRDRKWVNAQIPKEIAKGNTISVIELLPSIRFFHVGFNSDHWHHRGGVFGRSIRNQPIVQLFSYKSRFHVELNRISKLQPIDKVLYARQKFSSDVVL